MRHYHTRSASRTAALSRHHWMARGGFILLVALAVTLIWLSQADNRIATNIRTTVTDGLVPLVATLSAPADFIERANDKFNGILYLYEENARLQKENARLVQWQNVARQLEAENASLRKLAGLKAATDMHYISARIVGSTAHLYSHTIMLDSGSKEGIEPYQAVLTHEGLVGRIKDMGKSSARVIAITDINSRIPVMGESSRDKAILTGDNSDEPLLAHLPEETGVHVGERIITTSDGGVFPAGLVVGEVTAIDGNRVRVKPYVDFHKLEYVRVVAVDHE